MSRKNRNANIGNAPAAPSAVIDNVGGTPSNVGVVNNAKTIADLLRMLSNESNRNEQKKIRRRLRSLGHWGARKTATITTDNVVVDAPAVARIADHKAKERALRASNVVTSV